MDVLGPKAAGGGTARIKGSAVAREALAVVVGAAVSFFAWYWADESNDYLDACYAGLRTDGCECWTFAVRMLMVWFSPALGAIAAGLIARRAHWRAGLIANVVCLVGASLFYHQSTFFGAIANVMATVLENRRYQGFLFLRELAVQGFGWSWWALALVLFGPVGGWLGGKIRKTARDAGGRRWPAVAWGAVVASATAAYACAAILDCPNIHGREGWRHDRGGNRLWEMIPDTPGKANRGEVTRIVLGCGSGLDGLELIEVTQTGNAFATRSAETRTDSGILTGWQEREWRISTAQFAAIAAQVDDLRIWDLARAYHGHSEDGTQWVLFLQSAEKTKVVYFNNFFPERALKFAAAVDEVSGVQRRNDAVGWVPATDARSETLSRELWDRVRGNR